MSSEELVELVHEFISMFDDNVLAKYSLEKIKTMGDNYMLASGFSSHDKDHADNVVEAAMEMIRLVHEFNEAHPELKERFPSHCNRIGHVISVRVGVHTGEVVAGIVGNRKPVYDVFGESVCMASRMESTGLDSEVQISEATYNLLSPRLKEHFVPRKNVLVKGIGIMDTYITQRIVSFPRIEGLV